MADSLVVQAMRGFKADLLAQEQQSMLNMATRWLDVERALDGEINDLAQQFAERREAGQSISEAALYRMDRYKSMRRQLQDELTRYTAYANTTISGVQQAFGEQAITQAAQLIRMQYPGGVGTFFDRLPIEAVENMVGLTGDGSPLTQLLTERMADAAAGITRELLNGTALGRNPREVARRMVRNGMSEGLNSALNIARTEQMRVYRQTAQQQYEASGVVAYHVRIATHDDRVCPACLMAEGEVLQPGEPVYDHPQGRCTSIPVVSGYPVPQFQKGETWFREQGAETQRKILGPGRYNAWKAGDFELNQLVTRTTNRTWGASLHPTPLSKLIS